MNPIRGWNKFWFSTIPSGPMGMFRIVFGFIVFASALLLFPDRNVWFSDRGLLTWPDAYNFRVHGTSGPRHIDFLAWVHHDWMLTLFFIVYLAAAFCMMIGLWTRPAIFITWICLNCWHNRNPVFINSGDCLMLAMTIYLLLAPSDASCSVDRLIRILRGTDPLVAPRIVPWTQRLMQLQLCLLYFCTFFGKVQGNLWQNGTAAYYPLQLQEFYRFPMPDVSDQMWLIHLMTWGALAVEFSLFTLIWVPRLRLFVISLGVLLHLGIEYSMNIPFFSFLVIASYMTFLRPSDYDCFKAWLSKQLRLTPLRLVYDGECEFCRSSLLVVRYLDVFEKIKFLDYHNPSELEKAKSVSVEEADKSVVAVDFRDRKRAGFYAFRQMAGYMPAIWLIIPILYIPGVPLIGKAAYQWVADNRSKLPVAERVKRSKLA
jgi:predicted DCC family thiol-disulfide oxidoreductase YuxK